MAKKAKSTSKKQTKPANSDATNVTRIKAKDTSAPKEKTKPETKPVKSTKKSQTEDSPRRNPLVAFGGYFVGAWQELRQVRWPNRRTTWALTLAVLVFTAFFVVLIVLLDAGFQLLFEQILG